jgi:hypothetical protein
LLLTKIGVLVKARNFLVSQGDIESVAAKVELHVCARVYIYVLCTVTISSTLAQPHINKQTHTHTQTYTHTHTATKEFV